MKRIRLVACLLAMIFLVSCAGSRTLIVLLPDSDGDVGTLHVETRKSAVTLDKAFSAVSVIRNKDPEMPYLMGAMDIEDRFRDAIDSEPLQRFRLKKWILYCRIDSTELTSEAKVRFDEMIQDLRTHPPVEIYVVGHTDRLGPHKYNILLSRQRAIDVQQDLVLNGIDPEKITVSFLGESTPLVMTSDQVSEPRNRRVELIAKYSKEN